VVVTYGRKEGKMRKIINLIFSSNHEVENLNLTFQNLKILERKIKDLQFLLLKHKELHPRPSYFTQERNEVDEIRDILLLPLQILQEEKRKIQEQLLLQRDRLEELGLLPSEIESEDLIRKINFLDGRKN
jgi:type I site-specific restriction endonuclease